MGGTTLHASILASSDTFLKIRYYGCQWDFMFVSERVGRWLSDFVLKPFRNLVIK